MARIDIFATGHDREKGIGAWQSWWHMRIAAVWVAEAMAQGLVLVVR